MKEKMVLNQLFEVVWKKHWDTTRFRDSGHAYDVKRNYDKHIGPTLGDLSLRGITRGKIADWHQELKQSPFTANRCLEVLSKLFRYAEERDWIDQGSNPCMYVKAFTEKRRSRFASKDEVKSIAQYLEKYFEKQPFEATFIFSLIYSGARPSSLERARWEDLSVNEDGIGILTFNGKTTEETGDQETVVFVPEVMGKINNLFKMNSLIFGGMKSPRSFWEKIRKETGCKDLRMRDLRRTFATIALSNGVGLDTIGELLNHKSTQTTKIYAKLDSEARINSLSKIAGSMNILFSGKGR